MGTTSQKLEYLNGTKNSLKSAINNLGGAIDSNTTFRAYASELDTIYNNLPKVSDTGTNVSLSPTLKGRLGIVPKGNTYQETTTGKNLLDTTITTQTLNGVTITKNNDGSVTLNGTSTAPFNIIWRDTITLEAGTYYIGLITTTNKFNLYFNKSGGGFEILGSPASSQYYTLTLSEQTTYTGFKSYIGVSGTTFNNETFYPMITKTLPFTYEKYTNGASPNPDYPQEIQSAKGRQNVVVSGKNLFDKNITPENYSYNSSGVKTSDTDLCINQIIENVNYGNIYISFASIVGSAYVRVCEYNSSGTFIKRTLVNTNQSLSLDNNTKKLIFSVNASSSKYFTDLQIEKGSTSTPYQPYITPQEVDIELSSRNKFVINNYNKSGWNVYIENPIKDMATGQYTISCVNYLDNNNTGMAVRFANTIGGGEGLYFVGYTFGKSIKSYTQTLTSTEMSAKYMVLMPENNALTQTMIENMQIMIEQGSSATEYTPYYNYTLNKIGDYEDYIDGTPDNWVLKKNIGKVVLDGNNYKIISKSGTSNNNMFFTSVIENILKPASNSGVIQSYSNCFTPKSIDNMYVNNILGIGVNRDGAIGIGVTLENQNNTVALINTWLSSNNVKVIYPLETTQQTPITDTNLISQLNELYYLQSYNDTTNIDVTGNLPMRITASAIKGA